MGVLSIQSHVSYGLVGNAIATFALQRCGFDVWPIHTLAWSNHPGLGPPHGIVFAPDIITDTITGLEGLDVLTNCEAVITGYLAKASTGAGLAKALERIRQRSPGVIYICDPVMGDAEYGAYVDHGVAEAIRNRLVPLSDIVTPNGFELEELSGISPMTPTAAIEAGRALCRLGPNTVVATGLTFATDTLSTLVIEADGAWLVETPQLSLENRPHGAGDLFVALFLAAYLRGRNAADAAARAVSGVYALIEALQQSGARHLPIVQHQDKLIAPSRPFEARQIR